MKYNFNMNDICKGERIARCVVNMFVNSPIEERQRQTVYILRELIVFPDNA